jgi:hypothetical protein
MTRAPALESAEVGRRYRFDRPTVGTVLADLRIPAVQPGPGDKIPTFDLPTTDGRRFSSADVAARGRPLVLVFGSLTCPITESAGPGLVALHRRYGDAVDFVAVNVREAHPGASLRQPQLAEAKVRHARALKRHHGFDFPVAVDDIDGTVHRAFGTRPSSAYVIDATGTIVFRAHWSNRVAALEDAVRAVHDGRAPRRAAAGETVRALAGMAGPADVALRAAGRGALRDFWLVAPPVAALLSLARVLRRLTGQSSANRLPGTDGGIP